MFQAPVRLFPAIFQLVKAIHYLQLISTISRSQLPVGQNSSTIEKPVDKHNTIS